ncbi:MAG TPA: hypothetical protein VK964_00930 [Nocardioidaceae bacterium]|nr:hypothetical protein [Nocardioidaceae bacterium]
MSDVFRQIARYDCSATLVTEAPDGGMAIVAVYPDSTDGEHGQPVARHQRGDEDDCPIHWDTEIGMLLLYLERHPNIRCRLVQPGCEMQLVDNGKDDDLSPCT